MASDSVMDERTLREIYLTGFEIAVKEGRAKSIMSSYNRVNGTYANEPPMLPWMRSLAQHLPLADGVLFYSMWSGYREKAGMSEFLNGCRELGLKEETLHTSGHAGCKDMKALINRVNPDKIIPVHTLRPEWFAEKAGYSG